MTRFTRRCGAATATFLALSSFSLGAQAQAIKVGIVGPFSGPFAHYGTLFKNSVEAYLASQGGKLGDFSANFFKIIDR